MTGDELREHLREVLDADAIGALIALRRIQGRVIMQPGAPA